ncbi:3-amino-3-carboxypropyl transferase [Terfezia claveryi]|nr:3-amino-3-carboxypropyl transferase [Terfezia claveryi]
MFSLLDASGLLHLSQQSTHFSPIVISATAFPLIIFGLLAVTIGKPYLLFFYNCFIKPHAKSSATGTQQDALESFYQGQAAVYDATRGTLLRGRIEMLKLASAQLKFKAEQEERAGTKRERTWIWVDIGGGTGYNVEKLNEILPIEEYFSSIYVVDLSPSLLAIARKRFEALGLDHIVKVVCMDVRKFRIEDFEASKAGAGTGVDWITMSYSLSMIPDFYPVIDSLTELLTPTGIISVADFYVQSKTNFASRTYTGGLQNRHVNWFSRLFWRTWFEFDRVNLDEGRRDYLEYRFGTVLSIDERNRILGGIPYYIWVGCTKTSTTASHLEQLDASFTNSPYLSPANFQKPFSSLTSAAALQEQQLRSKGFEAAILNLSTNLPLPASFYQNHPWRIYYNELNPQHTQFNNDYIYAFTWEDPQVDHRLLKISQDDTVLAITSAGDNILSYILDGNPRRIHAVDMNPAQNHLLELKVAAFSANLSYEEIWSLFGDGIHRNFRELLLTKLSPHLSSGAIQFWHDNSSRFTRSGLYETGGSRIAIKVTRWLFRLFGVSRYVTLLCNAKTLNEQREIWKAKLRPVILSWWVSWAIIGNEQFLWRALGVPGNQRDMIYADYYRDGAEDPTSLTPTKPKHDSGGKAIWEYVVNTLDPVVETTLIGSDNYFYEVCLQGKYSKRCHPTYLDQTSYKKLTRPDALSGVRIHTDGIMDVLDRIKPGTLTLAVVMDSMDWFTPDLTSQDSEARTQIRHLNRALALNGRVFFRSAGLKPWYTRVFEQTGFECRRVGTRLPGACIDRVNMYASTWICTKVQNLRENGSESPVLELAKSPGGTLRTRSSSGGSRMEELEI